jgi:hypothetical protein
MNIMPFFVIWACLAGALLLLAAYRKFVTRNEDDYIHVAEGEAKIIPQQIEMAKKLDTLDRWGKILTIVTAVYSVLLGAAYLYKLWEDSSKPIS